MKKTALIITFIVATLGVFAQVGVGTTAPTTTLDIVGANGATAPGTLTSTDGVTIPRVNTNMTTTTVTGSTAGQLVYSTHTNSTGFYYWNVPTTGTSSWLPIVDGDAWGVTGEDITSAIGRTGSVGIGTTTPAASAALEIKATDKAFLLPRVANTAAINPAVNGMLIYDNSSSCVKSYVNGAWTECAGSAVLAADCNQNGIEGVYIDGTSVSTNNKFTMTVTNTNNSSFSITGFSTATSDVVLSGTGVGTVSVSSVSPASVSLLSGQSQTITYSLTGTPDIGTLQVDWTKFNLSCTATKTVMPYIGSATFTLPGTSTVGSINDGVIDIQGVIDNGTNQHIINLPYTNGVGVYNAYTSTVVNNATGTGEGGDANGFSISYPAGTFSTSGTIPITIFVDGDGTFNAKKQLIDVSDIIATIDFQLNSLSYGNIILNVFGGILDRNFADVNHKFVYLPITSATGETWLNNNLGADYSNMTHSNYNISQQANMESDGSAYGSLYQWGRNSDGHEIRTSSNTATSSDTDTPGHGDFIDAGNDWRTTANPNLWQGVNGINNPCPIGYRLPTELEFQAEINSWVPTNAAGALASPLKLTRPGFRFSGGILAGTGYYWTSTTSGIDSRYVQNTTSSTNTIIRNGTRNSGLSVRCIKD